MGRRLRNDGSEVAQCTVEQLMRKLGITRAQPRRNRPQTTLPAPAGRPADLLARDVTADASNRRWVADTTPVDTTSGGAYAAFVTDVFSGRIVGWQVADHLRADLAFDALEMAIWSAGGTLDGQLVQPLAMHVDPGVDPHRGPPLPELVLNPDGKPPGLSKGEAGPTHSGSGQRPEPRS